VLEAGDPLSFAGGPARDYLFTVFLRFAGLSSNIARRSASFRVSARKRAQSSRCEPETNAPGGVDGLGPEAA